MKIMDFQTRIEAIKEIGRLCETRYQGESKPSENEDLPEIIEKASYENPWFTQDNILMALNAWAEALAPTKVDQWIAQYNPQLMAKKEAKTIGLVAAGNIPLVGLHDILCILLTGNKGLVKLSSDDALLIPGLIDRAAKSFPELTGLFEFTDGTLKNFDAIIATGSNNTSRYFEYYFSKYPNIIRKNRNSAAILTGEETGNEIHNLGNDIFSYFGLGCRNVSKIYLPKGFGPGKILEHLENYNQLANHHKYFNNYEYQKAILLINKVPFHDNGFLLLKEETAIASPISVVHYEYYDDLKLVKEQMALLEDDLQCIVSQSDIISDLTVKPGHSQKPELWDYADNVDVVEFLTNAC